MHSGIALRKLRAVSPALPNYALKLTSAATAAPHSASVLRTDWRAARLVDSALMAVGGDARSLTLCR
jgi:hypothetical protein